MALEVVGLKPHSATRTAATRVCTTGSTGCDVAIVLEANGGKHLHHTTARTTDARRPTAAASQVWEAWVAVRVCRL